MLLSSLLKALPPKWPVLLLADRRMPLDDLDAWVEVQRIVPSMVGRFVAEKLLARPR